MVKCGKFERKRYTAAGAKCGPHLSPRKPASVFKKGDLVIGRDGNQVYEVVGRRRYRKMTGKKYAKPLRTELRKKARKTYKSVVELLQAQKAAERVANPAPKTPAKKKKAKSPKKSPAKRRSARSRGPPLRFQ
jgi:hypothetical protein